MASSMTQLSLGDALIDIPSRRVVSGGVEHRLSPKAIGVLMALSEAEGRVVSREDLLNIVWPDVHVGEEVLTQAVAELRRALGDKARQPQYVETISKQGYRLLVLPSVAEPPTIPATAADPAPPGTAGPSRTPPMAHPAYGGPSVVVIPFESVTAEPQAQAIATGLSRDIAVSLARSRWLFVAGRGSATVVSSTQDNPMAVAQALGVRYALSGSLMVADGRLRAMINLCDAASTQIVWADRFDRPAVDVFDLLDEIGQEVGRTVESEIEKHLRSIARLSPIETLDAWGLYHRADGPARYAGSIEEIEAAREILKKARSLAPSASRIVAAWSSLELRQQLLFEPVGKVEALKRSFELANAAVELDSEEPDSLVALGCALGIMGQRQSGMEHLERAVKLNPSSYNARSFFAWALLLDGQPGPALEHVDVAEAISPVEPLGFTLTAIRAHALALSGDFEAAYRHSEEADLHPRSSHLASAVAAWCAAAAGKPEKARFHAERLLHARPDFSRDDYFSWFRFNDSDRETISRYLHEAGL